MTSRSDRLVTVLVPARNELGDIDACLDAILAQDFSADDVEIIVVDGGSTDGTGDQVRQRLSASTARNWKVIENPVGATPSNLNVGLRQASGAYVCRVDARSRIPTDYVRRCVDLLIERPDLKVVGGAQVAVPPTNTTIGRGIARALNNRYTMGLARYRRGATSGPSDTVYLGFFRTIDLIGVDGWDEALPTNQDFDLNQRLGGSDSVWFEAGIDVEYVPRRTFSALWQQYHRFGQWKVRYWRHTGTRPRPRQMVLLTAPIGAGAAFTVLFALGPRGVRPAAVPAAIALLAAMDAAGARSPAGPSTRVAAVAASLTVGLGWFTGIWRELLRRQHG